MGTFESFLIVKGAEKLLARWRGYLLSYLIASIYSDLIVKEVDCFLLARQAKKYSIRIPNLES